MSGHRHSPVKAHDACDEFFSIAELVQMFLDECSANVLLNCARVCSDWNQIIRGTDLLQEHLFSKPAVSGLGSCRKLNPILQSHFAPILCPDLRRTGMSVEDISRKLETGSPCTYADIATLAWTQDSSIDAPKRQAFTRPEASWREMLVSQPPLRSIDWWHEWLYDENATDDDASGATRRGFSEEAVDVDGWGHQDQSREYVTLGMLWDLVEGRLARGCLVRVHYFLEGKAVEDDPFATEAERRYIAANDSQRRYEPSTPRVKISTQQIWNKVPWNKAGFDMTARQWVDMPLRAEHVAYGDGFNALRADCKEDWRWLYDPTPKERKSGQWRNQRHRFSQSERFRWYELGGESSGMVGRDQPSVPP
jgi:hypothetical protein